MLTLFSLMLCIGGSKHGQPYENIFKRNILVGTTAHTMSAQAPIPRKP